MTMRVATEYTHTQSTASATWNVVHNFGGYPIVDVYVNNGGQLVKTLANITFVDNNQVTVTFATAQTGFARCT